MKYHNALLIEDNITIAKQIIEFFEPNHWHVDHAGTGKLGHQLACSNLYDVVILDITLPDTNGFEVCKLIKEECAVQVPILMLTARDSIDDKITGLAIGADDYLTKPFNLRELILRCHSLTRRQHLHQSKVINIGELSINTTEQSCIFKGKPVLLTHVGYKILTKLAIAHPSAVSRSAIIHELWGDEPPQSDALKSHMYGLRMALDKHAAQSLIKTLPQVGYRLNIDANE